MSVGFTHGNEIDRQIAHDFDIEHLPQSFIDRVGLDQIKSWKEEGLVHWVKTGPQIPPPGTLQDVTDLNLPYYADYMRGKVKMGYALVKVVDCEESNWNDHFSKVIFASRDESLVVSEKNRLLEESKRLREELNRIREHNMNIVYKYKNKLRQYLTSNIDKLIPLIDRPLNDVDIEIFLENRHRNLYNLSRLQKVGEVCGPQFAVPDSLFDGIPEPEYDMEYPTSPDYYLEHELEIIECEVA